MQKSILRLLAIALIAVVSQYAQAEHIEIKVTSTYGSAIVYVEDDGGIVAVQTIRKSNKINSKADKIRILTYSADFKLKQDIIYDIPSNYYRALSYYSDGYYYLVSSKKRKYIRDWDGPKVITAGMFPMMETAQAKKYSFMRFGVNSKSKTTINLDLREYKHIWFSSAYSKDGSLYLAANHEPKVKRSTINKDKSIFYERYKYMTYGQICKVDFNNKNVTFNKLPYAKSRLCHLLTVGDKTFALVATNENITNTNLFDYRLGLVGDEYKEIGTLNIKNNSLKVGKIEGVYDNDTLFITTCSQTLTNEEAITGYDVLSFGMGVGYTRLRAYMEDMPLINFSSVSNTVNTKSYFLEDFRDQLDTLIELKSEEVINDPKNSLLSNFLMDRRILEISAFINRTANNKNEYIGVYKIYRGFMTIEEETSWNSDKDRWETKYYTIRHEKPRACLVISFDSDGNINWSKAFEMFGDEFEKEGNVIFTKISGENILLKLRSNEQYFNYTIDASGNAKDSIEQGVTDNQNRNYYIRKYRDIGNTYIYKHSFFEDPLDIE